MRTKLSIFLCFLVLAPLAFAAPARYRIVVKADPPDAGVVSGGGVFLEGTTVTVSAVARPGFAFVNWTEEDQEVSTSPEYQFVVTASRTLVAHFAPVPYVQLGGRWTGRLQVLPAVVLERNRFELSYTFGQGHTKWEATAALLFTDAGFISMTTRLSGGLGPFRISGGLSFDPAVPAYTSGTLMVSTHLAEYRTWLDLWVRHYASWGVAKTPYMVYSLTLYSPPIRVVVEFDDDCTGIAFKDLTVKLRGLGLCCGITYDAELSFAKAGFDYVEFHIEDLFTLCCGITLDATVKFTEDAKEVSLEPEWEGFGTACFKVYGDVNWQTSVFRGIEIYGFRIHCDLGEKCPPFSSIRYPYLEVVTAFSPEKMAWAGFEEGEFQYIKLGFCGPGCCGGGYAFVLATYFGNTGGLFGFSRISWSVSVPILINFRFGINMDVGSSGTTFKVTWDWEF